MKVQPIQEEMDFEGLFDLNEDLIMNKSLSEIEREIKEALGDSGDSTGSSSGSEDGPTDEESCGEEDKQKYTEVTELKNKLEKMMSTNTFDEVLGLLVVKTLFEIPMSKDILCETHIDGTVNDFRQMSNNKETNKLGQELILKWRELLPQSPKINQAIRDEEQVKPGVEHSMKRPSRDSESGTEDPVLVKKQKPEGGRDKNENTTESQICFMEVINNQPPNMEAIKFDTNRENMVARGNALIYVYVKWEQVDITSINSCRVFSDICDLIQRKPDITQSNRSLRILCKDETEKNIFMDTS